MISRAKALLCEHELHVHTDFVKFRNSLQLTEN